MHLIESFHCKQSVCSPRALASGSCYFMLPRQEQIGLKQRVLGGYLWCTGIVMFYRRTSGQRSTSTAECHRQRPIEGELPAGADDPDEQWPGHRHNNTSQARPFHQASRNVVNDKVSPKSQRTRQTIDKPAAQSATHNQLREQVHAKCKRRAHCRHDALWI